MGWITYVLKPLAAQSKMRSVSTGGSVIATPRRKKYIGVSRRRAGLADVVSLGMCGGSLELPAPQTAGDHGHNDARRAGLCQHFGGLVSGGSGRHDIVGQQHR